MNAELNTESTIDTTATTEKVKQKDSTIDPLCCTAPPDEDPGPPKG